MINSVLHWAFINNSLSFSDFKGYSFIRLYETSSKGKILLAESHEQLITIGRAKSNDVHLNDPRASWEHGKIFLIGNSFHYLHTSKTNSSIIKRQNETYILNAGILEQIELKNNDILNIGSTEILIECSTKEESYGYITTEPENEESHRGR